MDGGERKGGAPDAQRASHTRVRRMCVVLVCIDPDEDLPEVGLRELPVRVLRVRQPLPACERIRAVRPNVVLVGPTVKPWALEPLHEAARQVGAVLLELGPLVQRSALRAWLVKALEDTSAQREREAGGT